MANHSELSPNGPPSELLVEGSAPSVEILSATAVRFSWAAPNPRFLAALAAASPPFIYRPAHYLKAFHPRYAERTALERFADDQRLPGWAAAFERRDQPYRLSNPDRPSLQPWINTTAPPSDRYVGQRNVCFHRIDSAGRQLPYIDQVVIARTDRRLVAAKAASGEASLQATGLSLRDFTLLKEAEAEKRIKVLLWPIGRGSQLALYPNLNAADPTWRSLMRRPELRRALSLAIDRNRITQTIYHGLAKPRANTVLPESPLFRPAFETAWARSDPLAANRLLDGLGLQRRASDGIRLTADGTRLDLVVSAGDSDPAEIDVLEQIAASWRGIGVALLARPTGRQAFRRDVRSGRSPMSIFYGLANGMANAATSPAELAPTSDRQNSWPQWGLHAATGGRKGLAPDLPVALRLLELLRSWDQAKHAQEQRDAWDEMLALPADQVFAIGIVGQMLQPVVADAGLRNLPTTAFYMYEPGAYFGLTRADTYFFD